MLNVKKSKVLERLLSYLPRGFYDKDVYPASFPLNVAITLQNPDGTEHLYIYYNDIFQRKISLLNTEEEQNLVITTPRDPVVIRLEVKKESTNQVLDLEVIKTTNYAFFLKLLEEEYKNLYRKLSEIYIRVGGAVDRTVDETVDELFEPEYMDTNYSHYTLDKLPALPITSRDTFITFLSLEGYYNLLFQLKIFQDLLNDYLKSKNAWAQLYILPLKWNLLTNPSLDPEFVSYDIQGDTIFITVKADYLNSFLFGAQIYASDYTFAVNLTGSTNPVVILKVNPQTFALSPEGALLYGDSHSGGYSFELVTQNFYKVYRDLETGFYIGEVVFPIFELKQYTKPVGVDVEIIQLTPTKFLIPIDPSLSNFTPDSLKDYLIEGVALTVNIPVPLPNLFIPSQREVYGFLYSPLTTSQRIQVSGLDVIVQLFYSTSEAPDISGLLKAFKHISRIINMVRLHLRSTFYDSGGEGGERSSQFGMGVNLVTVPLWSVAIQLTIDTTQLVAIPSGLSIIDDFVSSYDALTSQSLIIHRFGQTETNQIVSDDLILYAFYYSIEPGEETDVPQIRLALFRRETGELLWQVGVPARLKTQGGVNDRMWEGPVLKPAIPSNPGLFVAPASENASVIFLLSRNGFYAEPQKYIVDAFLLQDDNILVEGTSLDGLSGTMWITSYDWQIFSLAFLQQNLFFSGFTYDNVSGYTSLFLSSQNSSSSNTVVADSIDDIYDDEYLGNLVIQPYFDLPFPPYFISSDEDYYAAAISMDESLGRFYVFPHRNHGNYISDPIVFDIPSGYRPYDDNVYRFNCFISGGGSCVERAAGNHFYLIYAVSMRNELYYRQGQQYREIYLLVWKIDTGTKTVTAWSPIQFSGTFLLPTDLGLSDDVGDIYRISIDGAENLYVIYEESENYGGGEPS
ncbi:MAG: hypothetical protein QXY76_03305 [Nitrososphaeria archaeon]